MIEIEYRAVTSCPLRNAPEPAFVERLARRTYTFGPVEIALPPGGVALVRCPVCDLVFKDRIPTPGALSEVMGAAATQVWKPARDVHPHAAKIRRLVADRSGGLIDIGAANGEVLAAAADATERRSAFDIVAFPDCAARVTGEYVLGQFEQVLDWSGEPYGLVTAFDVFEHFSDAAIAFDNIATFIAPGGALLLETGDHDRAFPSIGRWYYAGLFEHTIFWNRAALDFAARARGLRIARMETVDHKNLKNFGFLRTAALRIANAAAGSQMCVDLAWQMGRRDLKSFAHPGRADHMLATLERR